MQILGAHTVALIVGLFIKGGALSLHARNRSRTMEHVGNCVEIYANGVENVKPGLGKYVHMHRPTSTSPREITFGVGAGSAGSSSLAAAFVDMGIAAAHNCHLVPNGYQKWQEDVVHHYIPHQSNESCYEGLRTFDYTSIPEGIDAAFDDPIDNIFIDLFLSFPNAKFINHKRPAHEWAIARQKDHNGIFAGITPTLQMPCQYVIRDFNTDELVQLLDLHNNLVRCMVPPEKLFEFDVFSDGSEGLMHKLGIFMGMANPPAMSAEYPNMEAEELVKLSPVNNMRVNRNIRLSSLASDQP